MVISRLSRCVLASCVGVLVAAGGAYAQEKPHAAITPAPRDANWMKRHDLISANAKKGNIDLIFIGDSITQGWGDNAIWKKYYTPRHALNAGIGGDRTQHVLWRLDNGNIDGIKPKLAVIMIGTNNSRTETPEQIADGIKAIVAKLRERLPEMKILLLGIFPRGANAEDANRQVVMKANELAKGVADDKMVFYLDIGPKFTNEDGTISKEIMPDLLHLSPKGYQIWAESIEDKVKELMGEK